MAKLNVSIKSIKKNLYDGLADIVVMRTVNGDVGIMANHIPFMTALKNSNVKIKNDENEFVFSIDDGIAKVFDNTLTIINFGG